MNVRLASTVVPEISSACIFELEDWLQYWVLGILHQWFISFQYFRCNRWIADIFESGVAELTSKMSDNDRYFGHTYARCLHNPACLSQPFSLLHQVMPLLFTPHTRTHLTALQQAPKRQSNQMDTTPDFSRWTNASTIYKQVERVTLPLSQSLIARAHALRSLTAPDASAFDNGCGTGVLTRSLRENFPECPILAADASAGMIDILKTKLGNTASNITTRVLDARHLAGVADDTFTHAFSTFMICLAPDPEIIAAEMYRVTKPGGVLGLAVWGDPYFGVFNTPWTRACREVMPDYEPEIIMDRAWTVPAEVKKGVEGVGFGDVDVRVESGPWRWGSGREMAGYFFEGGNPGLEIMREGFERRGGDVAGVRGRFERVVQEIYGRDGGGVEAPVLACLVTARK